jgi:hypothetical protein
VAEEGPAPVVGSAPGQITTRGTREGEGARRRAEQNVSLNYKSPPREPSTSQSPGFGDLFHGRCVSPVRPRFEVRQPRCWQHLKMLPSTWPGWWGGYLSLASPLPARTRRAKPQVMQSLKRVDTPGKGETPIATTVDARVRPVLLPSWLWRDFRDRGVFFV